MRLPGDNEEMNRRQFLVDLPGCLSRTIEAAQFLLQSMVDRLGQALAPPRGDFARQALGVMPFDADAHELARLECGGAV